MTDTPFTRGQQARRPTPNAGLALMCALAQVGDALDAMTEPAPAPKRPEPETFTPRGTEPETFTMVLEPRRPSLADVARQLLRSADDAASALVKIAALLEPISQLAERALEEHDDDDDDQGDEDH